MAPTTTPSTSAETTTTGTTVSTTSAGTTAGSVATTPASQPTTTMGTTTTGTTSVETSTATVGTGNTSPGTTTLATGSTGTSTVSVPTTPPMAPTTTPSTSAETTTTGTTVSTTSAGTTPVSVATTPASQATTTIGTTTTGTTSVETSTSTVGTGNTSPGTTTLATGSTGTTTVSVPTTPPMAPTTTPSTSAETTTTGTTVSETSTGTTPVSVATTPASQPTTTIGTTTTGTTSVETSTATVGTGNTSPGTTTLATGSTGTSTVTAPTTPPMHPTTTPSTSAETTTVSTTSAGTTSVETSTSTVGTGNTSPGTTTLATGSTGTTPVSVPTTPPMQPTTTPSISAETTTQATTASSTVATPTITVPPTTSPVISLCENPKTIDYNSRLDEDVTILSSKNALNEKPENSLKGSGNSWTPSTEGSTMTYVVNGQNKTAQFVDGSFTIVNVEYVIIDLVGSDGKVITTEKQSFVNKTQDEQNTVTLNFGMQVASSLRLFVKPRTGVTVPSSLSNVEIKVCYVPGTTVATTTGITTSPTVQTTVATVGSTSVLSTTGSSPQTTVLTSPVTTGGSTATQTSVYTTSPTTPSETSTLTTVTVTLTTTVPEVCVFTKQEYMNNFGIEQDGVIGYVEKDNEPGLTKESEKVRIGDSLEAGTVVITANCSNCTCAGNGVMDCKIGKCKEDCIYTQWTEWSECSKPCDNGAKYRNRTQLNFNPVCAEKLVENEDCNIQSCFVSTTTPVCETWGEWSDCSSQNCGISGVRTKKRVCPGQPSEETEPCNGDCISTTPVCVEPMVYKCLSCPTTCKDYRMNSCVELDDCEYGCACPEGQVMDENNNCVYKVDCPCYNDNGVILNENFTIPKEGSKCEECKCTMGSIECYKKPDCCDWTEWGSWGECSKTCGSGFARRHRTLKVGEAGECGTDMETKICEAPDTIECYDCVIDGKPYSAGQEVGESADGCQTCYCNHYGSKTCMPSVSKTVNGSWSAWTEWGTCSKTCNGGDRVRTRQCNDPVPSCGGHSCAGNNTEVEPCNIEISCCAVSQWTEWGECLETCGDSNQFRARNYEKIGDEETCPPLQNKTQSRPCNSGSCECIYEEWTDWTTCSAECGIGIKTRTKTLSENNISPSCNATIREETSCYLKDCICDQDHQQWTNYSYCQKTCENRHEPVSERCSEVQQGCICEEGYFLDYKNDCVKDCVCNTSAGIKQPNEVWVNPDNKCETCECYDMGVQCSKQCEDVQCLPGEVKVAINDCCFKCEKVQDTCQMYTKTEKLERDGCVSVQNVTYNYCAGGCGDSTNKPMLMLDVSQGSEAMSKDCSCCTGNIKEYQTVSVQCVGYTQILTAQLPVIDKCECNKCSVTEYEETQSQASNTFTSR